MRLHNTLNDYLNSKNTHRTGQREICPGPLFAEEYDRIRDLEEQMTARYQTLYSKIHERISLILLNDTIYQRLEKRLNQVNLNGNEDLICQIETDLDLRRQKIIDNLLKKDGYSAHRHYRLRQAKINLMARRVNRLYPLMPLILKRLSDRYRPLRRDLIGCNTNKIREQINDLLEKFKGGQLAADSLIRQHIKNQAESDRERLYRIVLACTHQFSPGQTDHHLKKMPSKQLLAEMLSIILIQNQRLCPEIPLPGGSDIVLSARQSMSMLEKIFPEILANSLAFLKYRTAHRPVRFLTEVDFRHHPGDLFREGNFFDPACGKLYYQSTLPLMHQNDYAYAISADVLGLGMEAFIRNPEKFIQRDEEYFNFIFGNLSGDINRLTDRILTTPTAPKWDDLKNL